MPGHIHIRVKLQFLFAAGIFQVVSFQAGGLHHTGYAVRARTLGQFVVRVYDQNRRGVLVYYIAQHIQFALGAAALGRLHKNNLLGLPVVEFVHNAGKVGRHAVAPVALQVGFLAAQYAVTLGPLAHGYVVRWLQGRQGVLDVFRHLVSLEAERPGLSAGCAVHPSPPSLASAARTKVRSISLISVFRSFSSARLATGSIRVPTMPVTRLGSPAQNRFNTAKNFV